MAERHEKAPPQRFRDRPVHVVKFILQLPTHRGVLRGRMSRSVSMLSPAAIALPQPTHSIQSASLGIIRQEHSLQTILSAPDRTCWANSSRLNSIFTCFFPNIWRIKGTRNMQGFLCQLGEGAGLSTR